MEDEERERESRGGGSQENGPVQVEREGSMCVSKMNALDRHSAGPDRLKY